MGKKFHTVNIFLWRKLIYSITSIIYLLDNDDCVVDLLPLKEPMGVVDESSQLATAVSVRHYYVDAVLAAAVVWGPGTTRGHCGG